MSHQCAQDEVALEAIQGDPESSYYSVRCYKFNPMGKDTEDLDHGDSSTSSTVALLDNNNQVTN